MPLGWFCFGQGQKRTKNQNFIHTLKVLTMFFWTRKCNFKKPANTILSKRRKLFAQTPILIEETFSETYFRLSESLVRFNPVLTSLSKFLSIRSILFRSMSKNNIDNFFPKNWSSRCSSGHVKAILNSLLKNLRQKAEFFCSKSEMDETKVFIRKKLFHEKIPLDAEKAISTIPPESFEHKSDYISFIVRYWENNGNFIQILSLNIVPVEAKKAVLTTSVEIFRPKGQKMAFIR